MKVSIVIVTYNGIKWLDKCLGSCKDYNAIVIDNNSTDETVGFIKENYPKVKLIEQQDNLGFGAANNIGMSYALKQKCDYVFLLNQDAYLKKDTIDRLVEVYKENPEFGILSPIHLNGVGDKLDRNFSHYLNYENSDTFYFDAIHKDLKTIYDVPFVNAAAWLLPKKTLEKIGGFDPIFFHYGEDDNYCQRVLFHKFKIGVVTSSFIYHDRELKKEEEGYRRFSETYFNKKEKVLKVKWANPKINSFDEINKVKQSLINKIIKFRLRVKFQLANNYKKELTLIKNIEPEIIKSKKTNSKLGKHYI